MSSVSASKWTWLNPRQRERPQPDAFRLGIPLSPLTSLWEAGRWLPTLRAGVSPRQLGED